MVEEAKQNIFRGYSIIKSFSKYALVGIINTIVGISSILLLLFFFDLSHFLATFIGNTVGMFLSFYLNRKFTFHHKGSPLKSVVIFIGISLFCYYLAYVLFHNFLEYLFIEKTIILLTLELDKKYPLVLFEAILYTVFSYTLHRLITFRSPQSKKELSKHD